MNAYEFVIEKTDTNINFDNKYTIEYRLLKSKNILKRVFRIRDKWKTLSEAKSISGNVVFQPIFYRTLLLASKQAEVYRNDNQLLINHIAMQEVNYAGLLSVRNKNLDK